MNTTNSKIIHTNLYSQVAYDILDSVIGQLSDGWGENNQANEKWWRFADIDRSDDGEVLVRVSNEKFITVRYSGYRCCYVENKFCSMSDNEILAKFAGWIKKTMVMELKDNGITGGWDRDNVGINTQYLNRKIDINVSQVYCVYEHLLGRMVTPRKYLMNIIASVEGAKRSAKEAAAKKAERLDIDAKNAKYAADRKAVDEWEKAEIERIKKEAEAKRTKMWIALWAR